MPELQPEEKNPAAVALGRLGGKAARGAGLRAWRAGLTHEQRRAISQRANAARTANVRARIAERMAKLGIPLSY